MATQAHLHHVRLRVEVQSCAVKELAISLFSLLPLISSRVESGMLTLADADGARHPRTIEYGQSLPTSPVSP